MLGDSFICLMWFEEISFYRINFSLVVLEIDGVKGVFSLRLVWFKVTSERRYLDNQYG